MSFDVGVALPQDVESSDVTAEALATYVRTAEREGFTSLWVLDNTGADVLSALTVLAFTAAVSERARLGTAVLLTALQSPLRLARDLATIDRLSGGRLIIGVGLGGDPENYRRHGVSIDKRAGHFEAGVRLLRNLLSEPYTTSQWPWWVFEDQPRPVAPLQSPAPPLWFGAERPPALARAVKLGDGWIGAGSVRLSDYESAVAHVRGLLRERDKRRSRFTIAKRVYVYVGSRTKGVDAELIRWFKRHYGGVDLADRVVSGPSSAICGYLDRLRAIGTDVLLLHPVIDMHDQMQLLAKDVLPSIAPLEPR